MLQKTSLNNEQLTNYFIHISMKYTLNIMFRTIMLYNGDG